MKRSKRLQVVRSLTERVRKQAEQQLGQAQQQLLAEQQKLAQLEGYRREYAEAIQARGRQGVSIVTLRQSQAFLARIDEGLGQQRQQIQRAEQQLELARQQWREAQGRDRALEGLVERVRDQERQDEEKSLQKAIDELSRRSRGRSS